MMKSMKNGYTRYIVWKRNKAICAFVLSPKRNSIKSEVVLSKKYRLTDGEGWRILYGPDGLVVCMVHRTTRHVICEPGYRVVETTVHRG